MSKAEKQSRRQEGRLAEHRGEKADTYWKSNPEIATAGHLTFVAGALAASYAIGWLTGKFAPARRYFEFNILAPDSGYVGCDAPRRSGCSCETLIG